MEKADQADLDAQPFKADAKKTLADRKAVLTEAEAPDKKLVQCGVRRPSRKEAVRLGSGVGCEDLMTPGPSA